MMADSAHAIAVSLNFVDELLGALRVRLSLSLSSSSIAKQKSRK